jgi:hypothetical protein
VPANRSTISWPTCWRSVSRSTAAVSSAVGAPADVPQRVRVARGREQRGRADEDVAAGLARQVDAEERQRRVGHGAGGDPDGERDRRRGEQRPAPSPRDFPARSRGRAAARHVVSARAHRAARSASSAT